CGLCGARYGDRAAVARLRDLDDAARSGVEPGIWPLVGALQQLPDLSVRASGAGDAAARTLPWVELGAAGPAALVQLENLVKVLRLAAGSLRLHWVIEVEYQHHLAFVLKPRHGGGPVAPATVEQGAADVLTLRQHLERARRLQWWRHAAPPGSG
ncbi:MAG: hypothetical protein WBO45_11680, partial [Planctomycetota bacterium]